MPSNGACTASPRASSSTFCGSEHYRFRSGLIDEIRQHWTYVPADPGSILVGFDYSEFDVQYRLSAR
jgi:hypothetical protein